MQKPDQRQVLKMFINQQFQQYPDILTKERILHSKGVADFIYCYCKANHGNNERIHELYITALLHDIGYLENHTGIDHSKKGISLLSTIGIHPDLLELIQYHGKYTDNPSEEQVLFWLADMCIGKDGHFEGYERRYESILARYDSDDKRLKDVNKIIDYLRIHFPEYAGNKIT